MLKAIGTLQLALAPLFVVPALTAQDGDGRPSTTGQSLQAQLDATIASIEYLAGLRSAALAGDESAVRAIVQATEAPRGATPQRSESLTKLQDELARLRFQLDRLLSDPAEVTVITSMPPSVVKALGLGGASNAQEERDADILLGRSGTGEPAGTSQVEAGSSQQNGAPGAMDAAPLASGTAGSAPGPAPGAAATQTSVAGSIPNPHAARPDHLIGTTPAVGVTQGLDASMRAAIQGDLGPLDHVSNTSRRRGGEPVALESEGYVADPIHLGKLLVRAGRPAEAVETLKKHSSDTGARYWLARAFQDLDREAEAIALYRLLADDGTAGMYGRHAARDLEFLEFKSALQKKR